jgi:hypothetical protein
MTSPFYDPWARSSEQKLRNPAVQKAMKEANDVIKMVIIFHVMPVKPDDIDPSDAWNPYLGA